MLDLVVIFAAISNCFCIECPLGWVTGRESCYLFHQKALTWSEASHYCLFLGSHLARVESAKEKDDLARDLQHLHGRFWLDGIDDVNKGEWRWAFNYNDRITTTFWDPGQPDNASGDEDCMETSIDLWHGLWNDFSCSSRQFSICEKEVS